MIWLTAGGLALSLAMVAWLLGLVLYQGMITFWPRAVAEFDLHNETVVLGQVSRSELLEADEAFFASLPEDERERARVEAEQSGGMLKRSLVRTGNFDLTRSHFTWVYDFQVADRATPEAAVLIERLEWGRFYGYIDRLVDGESELASGASGDVLAELDRVLPDVIDAREAIREIEREQIADQTRRQERARLDLRTATREAGSDLAAIEAAQAEHDAVLSDVADEVNRLRAEVANLRAAVDDYALVLTTSDGTSKAIRLLDIVRVVPSNELTTGGKLGVYLSRWWEFLVEDPREANSEGGVFPAIFGTVLMTLIMCVLVVPFGVMAALYLREYAKAGLVVSAVRISINNLAGVPSIVFGVFGLGFFCYIVGAQIDELFYAERLPNPTFGKGALIWASFTLALLTLPVVIVATEEAIAAVPNSMRQGSYACGASKWQTIQRIVLPRAMPGILTGTILAMARGAGEVAPLMIVGAVKLAPELPLSFSADEQFGINRSFMHLGFHIYDLGFQSQNSEAARPMVYTTTLLLILIVAGLNLAAIALRSRLRKRFKNAAF